MNALEHSVLKLLSGVQGVDAMNARRCAAGITHELTKRALGVDLGPEAIRILVRVTIERESVAVLPPWTLDQLSRDISARVVSEFGVDVRRFRVQGAVAPGKAAMCWPDDDLRGIASDPY